MWERPVTYVVLIVMILVLGIMLERSPLGMAVGTGIFDWLLTRGALVTAVYLFWRLVRAHERRVALEEEHARRQG